MMVKKEEIRTLLFGSRQRRIFWISLAVHLFLVFLILADFKGSSAEEFSVNLVEEPSSGPAVAAETVRLPPSPDPDENVNPPPAPPEPEVADLPPVPAPPEPEIADLPMPMPETKKPDTPPEPKISLPQVPKRVKAVAEPKINLPAVPVKTGTLARSLPSDRVLKNTSKVGVRTGSQTNKDIPIGSRDAAQRYGEKFSDTPNGGRNSDARYAAVLGVFLKAQWSSYTPARAQLGDGKPEVTVWLAISGDGRLLEARIEKPSGNAGMDQAVARLLEALKRQQLPKSPDGSVWRNRVIFDTNG